MLFCSGNKDRFDGSIIVFKEMLWEGRRITCCLNWIFGDSILCYNVIGMIIINIYLSINKNNFVSWIIKL